MMGSKSNVNRKTQSPLLVITFSVLIVLVTIDIYLSILPPENCSFLPQTYHKTNSEHESYYSNEKEHPQNERITIDELVNFQSHDNRHGIVFHDIKALGDMGPAGDESWEKLFTPNGGYLFLNANESNPTGQLWEPRGISMFHGLHCLQMLRDTIRGLEGQLNQSNNEHQNEPRHEHNEVFVHYKHCFSYLAQSIACAADGTIEPPHSNLFKNGTFEDYNIDGMGVWHQCRDQSLLWKKSSESSKSHLEYWDYQVGDTVQSVWGDI